MIMRVFGFVFIVDINCCSSLINTLPDIINGVSNPNDGVPNIINDLSDSINSLQNILRDPKEVKLGVIYPINDLGDINDGVFLVKKMKLFSNYDPNWVELDVFYLKIDDFRSNFNRFSKKNDVPEGINHVGNPINTLPDINNRIGNPNHGVQTPINCVDNIKYYLLNISDICFLHRTSRFLHLSRFK